MTRQGRQKQRIGLSPQTLPRVGRLHRLGRDGSVNQAIHITSGIGRLIAFSAGKVVET